MNPSQYNDFLLPQRSRLDCIFTPSFCFRYPNIIDVQIYQNVPKEADFVTKCYHVYEQNSVDNPKFFTLKRYQLKEAIEVCLSFYLLSDAFDYSSWLKNIYKINGGSFNNLQQYEMMPIWKIQLLIRAHNEVQNEIEAAMKGGKNNTNGSHFIGVKPASN